MSLVNLETALAESGLRLLLLAGVPSPWSEAALAMFRYKGLRFTCTRSRPQDPAFRSWEGARNLPAVLLNEEPIRTGWAEILALAERLAPARPLVPAATEERVHLLGLCHELMGESGLMWSARLLAIDAGLATEGKEGFSLRAAQYLAPRYGWTEGCAPQARARTLQGLAVLDAELSRHTGPYFAGEPLSALDFYFAAVMLVLSPLPEEKCPMHASLRATFSWLERTLGGAITPALRAHGERMMAEFFELPLSV